MTKDSEFTPVRLIDGSLLASYNHPCGSEDGILVLVIPSAVQAAWHIKTTEALKDV